MNKFNIENQASKKACEYLVETLYIPMGKNDDEYVKRNYPTEYGIYMEGYMMGVRTIMRELDEIYNIRWK
jgi:hypothetical protein